MKRLSMLMTLSTLLALAMMALGEEGEAEPVSLRFLTERQELTDTISAQITVMLEGRSQEVVDLDDASNIAVVEITGQPGVEWPWHTHPGPAFVSVVEGEMVYVYADDCEERSYPAGTAFVDPGMDNVHMAFNPSETEEVVTIAVMLGAPSEGALTLPVDNDEQAALDAQCGFE